jgi:hypothetical protein
MQTPVPTAGNPSSTSPAAPDQPVGSTTIPRAAKAWAHIGRLPDGPLDILGDIHGELDALTSLLAHLGYLATPGRGYRHPAGRKLVFVGDLIDRGPDSPGVVRLVADLMASGTALAVMGNHDLNAAALKRKADNTWLFGHGPISPFERPIGSSREADELISILASLPVALEREDLRVVHAAWDDASVAALHGSVGAATALHDHEARIESGLAADLDEIDRNLAIQNLNPVRVLTSGPEGRAASPFFAGGKMRGESRERWWNGYSAAPVVVFGHYWRIPALELQKDDGLFAGTHLHAMLGRNNAICIDYSVGSRGATRKLGRPGGPFTGRLAALRWPERELVFDDGERVAVRDAAVQG